MLSWGKKGLHNITSAKRPSQIEIYVRGWSFIQPWSGHPIEWFDCLTADAARINRIQRTKCASTTRAMHFCPEDALNAFLHLLPWTSILNTMYHVLTSTSVSLNGVYGFINVLGKVVRKSRAFSTNELKFCGETSNQSRVKNRRLIGRTLLVGQKLSIQLQPEDSRLLCVAELFGLLRYVSVFQAK